MTTNITLNKTFEIQLEDNTTIKVMVCLEASTADGPDDDEDFDANQQIRSFTYNNVLEPLQEALTELFTAEDLSEMLTADDYPDSAE